MDTGLVKQSSGAPFRGSSERQTLAQGVPYGGWPERQTLAHFVPGGGISSGGRHEAGRRMEYLLVIYPYGELFEKLLEEQQQFLSDYGLSPKRVEEPSLKRNRPHITVAAFQAGEQMEETLIRWIHRICHRNQRFDITLNNYSGFPPHTIYLRVQDPQPFRQLMQQLRAIDDFIRSSGCPPVNLISRPYLSIAGGLTEQIYNKAMADYSRRTFHESFMVEELVLLKREHSFDPCRTVNVFRLPDGERAGEDTGRLERSVGVTEHFTIRPDGDVNTK